MREAVRPEEPADDFGYCELVNDPAGTRVEAEASALWAAQAG